ncbi:hypothetical protein AB2B41_18575 [Marimonas sp. MJW-29]|uniref:Uncharacterized protein n=1 Tax=Sulfitobacter sediminis TaxID=3234186 RepID=A0ABV3RRP2_9RHOB
MEDSQNGTKGELIIDYQSWPEEKEWLANATPAMRSTLAYRCALRTLGLTVRLEKIERETYVLTCFNSVIIAALRGEDHETPARHFDKKLEYLARKSKSASSARMAAIAALLCSSTSISDQSCSLGTSGLAVSVWLPDRGLLSERNNTDRSNLESNKTLGGLWGEVVLSEDFRDRESDFRRFLSSDVDWAFFESWYQGMWEGTWTDWDLAHEVAKIDAEVWEEGLSAVAAKIRETEAELLAQRVPQAEQINFDPESLRFSVEPISVAKPDLLSATLQQVEDALEDVLENPTNGLSERSREVRVIRRTLMKYGNNPQQVEMSFVSAHAGITRQLVSGDLSASEENIGLQSALEEAAIGIRATHREVANNRRILNERKFVELSEDQRQLLEEALPMMEAISDEDLADDWRHDIPELLNTSMGPLPSGAPALPGADAATRVFSRAAKISILMRTSNIVHAIDGSAGYKAVRIVTTIGALVGLGLSLLVLI